MPDPIFDPLRSHLTLQLKRGIIGQTLGFCPRTGQQIDVRTAVWILDPEGLPHMAMHADGWRQVLAGQDVEALAEAGIRVDPSNLPEALADRTREAGLLAGEPEAPAAPAQTETLF